MEKEASKLIKILNTVVKVCLQVIHSLESQRRLRRRRKGAKRSKLAKDIETNCNSNIIISILGTGTVEFSIPHKQGDLSDSANGVVQLLPGLSRHHVLLHQELDINSNSINTIGRRNVGK